MPQLRDATPEISVHLYKTISRETVDGQSAVSARYQGKDTYIDLTPYLGEGSSVVTSKSVREPAGGFSITFADKPHQSAISAASVAPGSDLESIYGLIEPMDIIEIRMWGGLGSRPQKLPIKMRGFVSRVQRAQAMSQDGVPVRHVVVAGQDYGKIWQMYQIVYLQAYSAGKPLLTTYNMWELFGIPATNTIPAKDFVRLMIEKVINPFIDGFMPEHSPMPRKIETGDSIAVQHGVVNDSYQMGEGSIYDKLRFHGDVGAWNELYTEDREDGVHCVYRPIPALKITDPDGTENAKIMDDAPDPVFVDIPESDIQSITADRSDSNVANFFWVNNQRYDMVSDQFRKLHSLTENNKSVNLGDHPNSAVKYYGVRQMNSETQQGDDGIRNATSGQSKSEQDDRDAKVTSWIDKRREQLVEMNKDNVVFESGTARIKGGPVRSDGEAMKAGDYARFKTGSLQFHAYVVSITDEFIPYQGYTTTLTYERGMGFAARMSTSGAPWLLELSSR